MSQHDLSLPAEISDTIVDVLSGDWRSLAACALASSALRPRACHCLCQNVIGLSVDENDNLDVHEFMRTFAPGSLFTELPISLHIYGGENFGDLPDVLQLGHLRNTRFLQLSAFDVGSIDRIRSLYLPLPRLEELQIYQLRVPPGTPEAPSCHETAMEPHRHLQRPCSPLPESPLKTLRIYYDFFDQGVVSICQAVGDDLGSMTSPKVSLKLFSCHLIWSHSPSRLAQVLANSASSLCEVRLSIRRPLHAGDDAEFYSALSECGRLRVMTLFICHGPKLFISLSACITSLATWLSSRPLPAFARTLKSLHIIGEGAVRDLYLGPGSLGSNAFANLALALLPGAYPALAAFRFTHHRWHSRPQSPVAAQSENEEVECIAQELAPLREAGVRVDVETVPMPSEMRRGSAASAYL